MLSDEKARRLGLATPTPARGDGAPLSAIDRMRLVLDHFHGKGFFPVPKFLSFGAWVSPSSRVVRFTDRRSWRIARRMILTASDVPAIMGLVQERSPWSVWEEKVRGQALLEKIIHIEHLPEEAPVSESQRSAVSAIWPEDDGRDLRDSEHLRWGNILEPTIAMEVASRRGRSRIHDLGRTTIVVNPDLPVPLGVTLDYAISPEVTEACPCAPHGQEQRRVGVYGDTIGKATEWHRVEHDALVGRGTFRDQWKWKGYAVETRPDAAGQACLCAGSNVMASTDPRGAGLIECKSVGAFGDPDRDWNVEGPPKAVVQLQTQLAVTGLRWGVLAGLLGSPAFHLAGEAIYGVKRNLPAGVEHERDDEFLSFMFGKLERFWSYVETKTPPPADDSVSTARALGRYYSRDDGSTVELPAVARVWAQELADAKEVAKKAEKQKRAARNQILRAIGNARVALLPGEEGAGGFRVPTLEAKVSTVECPGCKRDVPTRTTKSHRRVLAFGTARDLEDEEPGEGE